MLTIGDILHPEHIILNCEASTYGDAIGKIHQRLTQDKRVRDAPGFLEAIRKREGQGSTIIGNGLAIPHARTDTVSGMIMGVGRLNPPICDDMSEIKFVFLAGVPTALASDYLRILGAITRIFKNPSNVKTLAEIPKQDAFLQALMKISNILK